MLLTRLHIRQVRNLRQLELEGMERINVLVGPNGSGKTSILESVQMLSTARSFRSHRLQHVITRGEERCLVHGVLGVAGGRNHSLGVERERNGRARLRVDRRELATVAELSQYLPLQLINSESFRLLEGGPAGRRKYLDWGVFHVEHGFFGVWQAMQRSLRQRNSLLRHGKIDSYVLAPWDEQLAAAGEKLDRWRASYAERLRPLFRAQLEKLSPALAGCELRYARGWDRAETLTAVLERNRQGDIAQKTTRSGPQRADLKVLFESQDAGEILSRGQIKLVVCALRLAQGQLLQRHDGRQCIFLIDDLPAELDVEHRRRLCGLLHELGHQVLISCVNETELKDCWPTDTRPQVFHVEHGTVVSGPTLMAESP